MAAAAMRPVQRSFRRWRRNVSDWLVRMCVMRATADYRVPEHSKGSHEVNEPGGHGGFQCKKRLQLSFADLMPSHMSDRKSFIANQIENPELRETLVRFANRRKAVQIPFPPCSLEFRRQWMPC